MEASQIITKNIKPLLAKLIHNFLTGDYNQRKESAIALSKFKGEKATDFLLETYESDNIQDFMALALGNIDSKKSVDLLIRALNDSNQEVRFNAARALGMMEIPEAFDILTEAIENYAKNNTTGNLDSLDEESFIFLEEDSIIGAIIALGKIKNRRAIDPLKTLFNQEKNARIRASIIMALGMMASERMRQFFQAALRDEDPRVRANAIEALENLKSGSIVGILSPYLEDSNNRVRANCAKAIWKYGDFDVSDTLNKMLKHSDKWYRASAAYAIGEINEPKFIGVLTKALRDEDPDVRRNAANAIRKIELAEATPNLIPMLNDPNFDVRVEVIQAITRCSPDIAFDNLIKHLPNEDNSIVIATCISCLGQIKNPAAINIITPYLSNEDARVISNTIDALVKLCNEPDETLLGRLKYLLSHEDSRVKSTAIKALWVWGQYSVLDNLRSFFESNNKNLIQSATFVLGEIGKEITTDSELSESINSAIAELIENPDLINQLSTEKQTVDETIKHQENNVTAAQDGHKQLPATRTKSKQEINEPLISDQDINAKPIKISNDILPDNSFSEELTQAADFIAEHEYDEAEKIFNIIHKQAPKHVKALLAHGNMLFSLKRNNEAARLYKDALEINPNIVKALFNLGTIYFYARKYETSIQYLVKALNIYPKIMGAYLILAQIYQLAGKYSDSIKLLSRAASLSPRNPVIYQKLAAMHMHLHQFNEAIVVLKKALEISPVDLESSVLLAYCYNYTNRPQEAFDTIDWTFNMCSQSSQQENTIKQILRGFVFTKTALNNDLSGI